MARLSKPAPPAAGGRHREIAGLCYFLSMSETNQPTTDPFSRYTPLTESAVRADGTIAIKVIRPGWGSSGFYGRNMLEQHIAAAFPAGTKMFWNHDTASEEAERPEGDLRRLAAVTLAAPKWQDNGPKGPGFYTDALVRSSYVQSVNELGDHIGVSIKALGRAESGEAEGRKGRIFKSILSKAENPHNRIDFVTEPGAGGAIVTAFEAAANAAELPPVDEQPEIAAFLSEAGRVLSAANEKRLRSALEQLTAVLELLGNGENDPQEANNAMSDNTQNADQLSEANTTIQNLQSTIEAQNETLATMRRQLLATEAREAIAARLQPAALVEQVKTRLARQLAADVPVTEAGEIDKEKLNGRIDAAISEAIAEAAAIAGSNGAIVGQGGQQPPAIGQPAPLAESQATINAALAEIGYSANGS